MQQAINNVFNSVFQVMNGFLSSFIHDPGTQWGTSIVLFTILFNLIVFPLNWKAMKSSKKMSLIQPELKKIQEKYKNDPARMQEAQSKLMKDNNVSMLGGCLPMLIQMPLFIALFQVFRNLASQGTISKLSYLNPIIPDLAAVGNIQLTVITVITMLISSWLTQKSNERSMTAEAKAQAKSMNTVNYMMALMIGWFTWQNPAALGLYWITGNLFRIVQQLIMNSFDEKNPDPIVVADLPEAEPKRKRNKVIRK
ncbi:Inner membrane protein translocase component YidC, long form [Clostridiaceae bacterium JG1575]|nr:Inner membrane protein translocase component YidC, long form [Clostridiaceae bacterium JG1575]